MFKHGFCTYSPSTESHPLTSSKLTQAERKDLRPGPFDTQFVTNLCLGTQCCLHIFQGGLCVLQPLRHCIPLFDQTIALLRTSLPFQRVSLLVWAKCGISSCHMRLINK